MPKTLFSLSRLELAACIAALLLIGGCPPPPEDTYAVAEEHGPNTYVAAPNKLFAQDVEFDIRWDVVYPESASQFDPSLSVTDRELALMRCTKCHECGFQQAFDLANYGTLEWQPRYVGEDWAQPTQRMIPKENSMLNEAVAQRIYTFLRDETLGVYDEAADDKGAVIVEVDELPEVPPQQLVDPPASSGS